MTRLLLDRVSELEREIGHFLVSIQKSDPSTQNAKGRGAQKAFLRSVYNAEGVNGYVYYITYYLSLAAERGGSIEKLNASLASFKTVTISGKRAHSFLRMRLSNIALNSLITS